MVSKPYFDTHEWPCTMTTTTRPVVLHRFCWSGVPNRLTVSEDIHGFRWGEVRGHIAHARSASGECEETAQDRVSVRGRPWSHATDDNAQHSAVRRSLLPPRSIQYRRWTRLESANLLSPGTVSPALSSRRRMIRSATCTLELPSLTCLALCKATQKRSSSTGLRR